MNVCIILASARNFELNNCREYERFHDINQTNLREIWNAWAFVIWEMSCFSPNQPVNNDSLFDSIDLQSEQPFSIVIKLNWFIFHMQTYPKDICRNNLLLNIWFLSYKKLHNCFQYSSIFYVWFLYLFLLLLLSAALKTNFMWNLFCFVSFACCLVECCWLSEGSFYFYLAFLSVADFHLFIHQKMWELYEMLFDKLLSFIWIEIVFCVAGFWVQGLRLCVTCINRLTNQLFKYFMFFTSLKKYFLAKNKVDRTHKVVWHFSRLQSLKTLWPFWD